MSKDILKLKLLNQELAAAVELLKEDLSIEFSPEGLAVAFIKTETNKIEVLESDEGLKIYAKDRPHFIQALSLLSLRHGQGQALAFEQTYSFERNGIMIDNSRNAVMTVEASKSLLRKLALMGHSWCMLYLEDVYEITDEPYFGAMRGRYSKEELKELDRYACELGIELFPAIQTLAHLNQFMFWEHESVKYLDIDDILNVNRPETKNLLEKMLSNLMACFTSKRIHLGMDEAYNLGRGSYLDEVGLEAKTTIMLKHLNYLVEVCQVQGLQPIIWDDMFFSHYSKIAEGADDYQIPAGIGLMYWDYYHNTEAHYVGRFEQRQAIADEVLFAGGAWRWSGFTPHHWKTLVTTKPALKAAKAKGIKQVITTAWGDDGSETPFYVVMFGLVLYAYLDAHDDYNEAEFDLWLQHYTEQNLEQWLKQGELDLLPELDIAEFIDVTPSKYFLYQDLLLPTFMTYIEDLGLDYGAHMTDLAQDFANLQTGYAELNQFYSKYAETLALKWDLPLLIWQAYHDNDRDNLEAIIEDKLPALKILLKELLVARRIVWLQEAKPFGLEVLDYRFGAMIARVDIVRERLLAYLDGEITEIPELLEPRLPFDPRQNKRAMSYNRTASIMSRSRYSW